MDRTIGRGTLKMLSRLKFEISDLVVDILNNIPEKVWESKTSTFFDPCMGGGQFIKGVIDKLYKYGHTEKNIEKRIFGCEKHKNDVQYAIKKNKLIGTFWAGNPLEEEYEMKFDIVLGNLPFQDGSQSGSQNKIYNQLSKMCLDIVSENGIVALITPASVLKKSKRFSLIGQHGLKVVDFTADNHFTVGVKIISWIVDFQHIGKVTILHNDGNESCSKDEIIYDYSAVDREFAALYQKLKEVTNTPIKRMFKQNAVAAGDKKFTKTKTHKYEIFILDKTREIVSSFYTKREPHLRGKKKFIISRTKGFNDSATVVSTHDFDVAHMFTDVKNKQEIENIKSFLFSDYFQSHSQQWKDLDGYGFNDSLIYLPPFNKTKKWNNRSVEKFLLSFLND